MYTAPASILRRGSGVAKFWISVAQPMNMSRGLIFFSGINNPKRYILPGLENLWQYYLLCYACPKFCHATATPQNRYKCCTTVRSDLEYLLIKKSILEFSIMVSMGWGAIAGLAKNCCTSLFQTNVSISNKLVCENLNFGCQEPTLKKFLF